MRRLSAFSLFVLGVFVIACTASKDPVQLIKNEFKDYIERKTKDNPVKYDITNVSLYKDLGDEEYVQPAKASIYNTDDMLEESESMEVNIDSVLEHFDLNNFKGEDRLLAEDIFEVARRSKSIRAKHRDNINTIVEKLRNAVADAEAGNAPKIYNLDVVFHFGTGDFKQSYYGVYNPKTDAVTICEDDADLGILMGFSESLPTLNYQLINALSDFLETDQNLLEEMDQLGYEIEPAGYFD